MTQRDLTPQLLWKAPANKIVMYIVCRGYVLFDIFISAILFKRPLPDEIGLRGDYQQSYLAAIRKLLFENNLFLPIHEPR